MIKKELISDYQYFKLADILLDQLGLVKLTAVIKETRIGRGMNFLPRKTGYLINSLQEWLKELAETGTSVVRDKISSVLEELLRRKEMTTERYNELKQEHNIMSLWKHLRRRTGSC